MHDEHFVHSSQACVMLRDARLLADGHRLAVDVCIVGAGAAGLAIARELSNTSLQVAIIESGGRRSDAVTESLNRGGPECEGDYPVQDSRARYLGGATNLWSGICLPLDAIELESRPWLPDSGWPLTHDTLAPFYERACAALDLSPPAISNLDSFRRIVGERPSVVENEHVETLVVQSCGVQRLADTWGREVAAAANVTLWLHANAIALETDADGRHVESLRVACLSGPSFNVSARLFVLATGGIENARLLLASNTVNDKGVGNDHDLVGRFFADHYAYAPGYVEVMEPAMNLDFYTQPRWQARHWTCGVMTLRQETRRQRQLTGIKVRLYAFIDAELSAGVRALRRLLPALRQRRAEDALHCSTEMLSDPVSLARFLTWRAQRRYGIDGGQRRYAFAELALEQEPNRDNRVTLSTERDALGQQRAALRTHLSERDWSRARRGIELIEAALEHHGISRLRPWPDPAAPLLVSKYNHHQVGTTRMDSRSDHGVVDAECRVHGVANLYVAGSSVFPTVGSSNPTLTIVALAIRIADRVRMELDG